MMSRHVTDDVTDVLEKNLGKTVFVTLSRLKRGVLHPLPVSGSKVRQQASPARKVVEGGRAAPMKMVLGPITPGSKRLK